MARVSRGTTGKKGMIRFARKFNRGSGDGPFEGLQLQVDLLLMETKLFQSGVVASIICKKTLACSGRPSAWSAYTPKSPQLLVAFFTLLNPEPRL
jgi:hypothetical protein